MTNIPEFKWRRVLEPIRFEPNWLLASVVSLGIGIFVPLAEKYGWVVLGAALGWIVVGYIYAVYEGYRSEKRRIRQAVKILAARAERNFEDADDS